jgi:hypothetical protein
MTFGGPVFRMMKSRSKRWVGHVEGMGNDEKFIQHSYYSRPEGRRPLGKRRHRWEEKK